MTHTIPHYIKSNAKNYPKDIALREKKFGVWKTKDWQQCLEEIENITLGLHAKGIIGKKTIAILGNNTPRWTLAEIAVQSLGSIPLGIYSDALESEIIYLIDYSSCRVVFVEDEEQADKIMSLSDSKGKIDLIVYDEPKGMNKYDDKRLISYKNLLKTGHEFKKHNINFFNKDGEWLSEIVFLDRDRVEVKFLNKLKEPTKNSNIELAICLVKKSPMDTILQKATELGVTKITPIVSERTEVKELNFERAKKIVIEATEQSNQLIPPEISQVIKLKDFLNNLERI